MNKRIIVAFLMLLLCLSVSFAAYTQEDGLSVIYSIIEHGDGLSNIDSLVPIAQDIIAAYLSNDEWDVAVNTKGVVTGQIVSDSIAFGMGYINQSNLTIACYFNSDCNSSSSYDYCYNSQSCTRYFSYSCINPGMATSYCRTNTNLSCDACQNGCSDGECVAVPELSCSDSDGGLNYAVKGVVVNNSGSVEDYCYSANGLGEYYCYNNVSTRLTTYTCPNGCFDGKCNSSVQVLSCSDSDGGINYNVTGTAIDNFGSRTDSCSGNTLLESYCAVNNSKQIIYYVCPDSCESGKCLIDVPEQNDTQPPVENTYTDTDGGVDIFTYGEILDQDGNWRGKDICRWDSCATVGDPVGCRAVNTEFLTEYKLIGSSYTYVSIECIAGCVRGEGRCYSTNETPQYIGNPYLDTDGGKDFFVKGAIYDENGQLRGQDSCRNSQYVTEYFITPNGLSYTYKDILCFAGCSAGVCNPSDEVPPYIGNPYIDTDGGQNYNIKGAIYDEDGQFRGEDICRWDSCASFPNPAGCRAVNPNYVKEYYLTAGGLSYTYQDVDCPNGCSNGACIS